MGIDYGPAPSHHWERAEAFFEQGIFEFIGVYSRIESSPDRRNRRRMVVARCPDHGVLEFRLEDLSHERKHCRKCYESWRREQVIVDLKGRYPYDEITLLEEKSSRGEALIRGTCHRCGQSYGPSLAFNLLTKGPCKHCGLRGSLLSKMEQDKAHGGMHWSEPYSGYLIALRDNYVKFGIGNRSRAERNGTPILMVEGQRLSVLQWEDSCLRASPHPGHEIAKTLISSGGYTEVRGEEGAVELAHEMAEVHGLKVVHPVD